MKTKDLLRGIQIIRKYSKQEYQLGAEHDVIYVFGFEETYAQMTEAERAEMAAMGWTALEYEDLTDEEEASGEPPLSKGTGSWQAFV